MEVGEQVLRLRKRLGITQKRFGELAGCEYTYIGKIERGIQYPSMVLLQKIARAFNKPLSYFFEKDSEVDVVSERATKGAMRMRALACLFAKYCWDEGRFSVCPVTCELQDGLCKAVKALVQAKQIDFVKEK